MIRSLSSRSLRSLRFVGLVAGMLGLLGPCAAPAQVWDQTTRIATPISFGGPVEALLDTLVYRFERTGATVQRHPDWPERESITAVRDTLVDEYGIGIITANTLFVDYRFTVGPSGQLGRDVTGLHFVFRPGPLQEDIPLLYVDARQRWVQKLLLNEGTALPNNEAAVVPFRRALGFVGLAGLPNTRLVQIDGEPVREGFSVQKEALVQTIQSLAYGFE